MHYLGHAVQWLLFRVHGLLIRPVLLMPQKNQWGWEIIILFLPFFSLIFINVITQHWQQLFMSIAHSWPDLKFKAILNFNSGALTCPLPSPDLQDLHTLCCFSGSPPHWKGDLDQPLETCFLMAAKLEVLKKQMPSVSSVQQFLRFTGEWRWASKQGLEIKSPTYNA